MSSSWSAKPCLPWTTWSVSCARWKLEWIDKNYLLFLWHDFKTARSFCDENLPDWLYLKRYNQCQYSWLAFFLVMKWFTFCSCTFHEYSPILLLSILMCFALTYHLQLVLGPSNLPLYSNYSLSIRRSSLLLYFREQEVCELIKDFFSLDFSLVNMPLRLSL